MIEFLRSSIQMGDYTEFCFDAELVPLDKEHNIVDVLQSMTDYTLISLTSSHPKSFSIPDHNFFKCDRWRWLMLSDSAYFPHETTSKVFMSNSRWHVSIHSNIKNYNNEIEKFLDWIMPYVDVDRREDDCLGFYRHQYTREPTIIYYSEWTKPKYAEYEG